MSSESITTALFLITAVVASAVLISAVYPVISSMAGTVSSTTHESDVRMRTDFKIISTVASGSTAQIWMKNIGTVPVGLNDLERADVFCGAVGNFDRLSYTTGMPGDGEWTADLADLDSNGMWDPGETLKVTAVTNLIPATGSRVYFQFALSSGVWRSNEFTVS